MALRLHWPDERYARIYCRDTLDWLALSWDAQALWMQLSRKATRSGRIDLGRLGRRGVAALLGRVEMADRIDAALGELLTDGCVVLDGCVLVIPDFIDAQEAVSSGAARQRAYREKLAEAAATTDGPRTSEDGSSDETSRAGDETSQKVTRGYSTAGTARHGTAVPAADGSPAEAHRRIVPAREAARNTPGTGRDSALTGDAISRSFAADLDAEASREDKRRGRLLAALGSDWRPAYALAAELKRSVNAVERDLVELRSAGLIERAERGSPPVTHWHAHAVALAAASEDAA